MTPKGHFEINLTLSIRNVNLILLLVPFQKKKKGPIFSYYSSSCANITRSSRRGRGKKLLPELGLLSECSVSNQFLEAKSVYVSHPK